MRSLPQSRATAAWAGFAMCVVAAGIMPSRRADDSVVQLFELPAQIGTFSYESDQPLDAEETEILDVQQYHRGAYRCAETNRVIVVTLLTGSSGVLTSHHVEACYSRQTYQPQVIAHRWSIPGQGDDFQFRTLRPRRMDQTALTVAYAWFSDDRWTAPDHPRFTLAHRGGLQRLQASIQHPVGRGAEAMETLQAFLAAAQTQFAHTAAVNQREPAS